MIGEMSVEVATHPRLLTVEFNTCSEMYNAYPAVSEKQQNI